MALHSTPECPDSGTAPVSETLILSIRSPQKTASQIRSVGPNCADHSLVVVPANRTIMEWQERVAREVRRNRLCGGWVDLHQLLMVCKNCVHDCVNEIVWQIRMRHCEIVQPYCRVVPQQRWIDPRRN